jgi:hypothetical protein
MEMDWEKCDSTNVDMVSVSIYSEMEFGSWLRPFIHSRKYDNFEFLI